MVEEFAAAFGLSLPTASGRVVSYDFFRERLDDLTDDQTMFLDFTEALLVRFCRLWNPHINPESPGAKQIMEDPAFVTKKLGQWMHWLDRSSLHCHSQVLLPWKQGCLDTRSMILSVIGSVTLCSSATAAKSFLPLPSEPEACLQKLKLIKLCSCRFAYPRALLRVARAQSPKWKVWVVLGFGWPRGLSFWTIKW